MKRINLALQGGGAHGAYTWGVLDRLLDEPDIEIAAISGTSASTRSTVRRSNRAGTRTAARARAKRSTGSGTRSRRSGISVCRNG